MPVKMVLHKIGHATKTWFHSLRRLQIWLLRQLHRCSVLSSICPEPYCHEDLELLGRVQCGVCWCQELLIAGAGSIISAVQLFYPASECTAVHYRNIWPSIKNEKSFIWKHNKLVWVDLETNVTAASHTQVGSTLIWTQNLLATTSSLLTSR